MYIKYSIMRLLMMGYQSRVAVLSPSCYGVPQVGPLLNRNNEVYNESSTSVVSATQLFCFLLFLHVHSQECGQGH